VLFRSTLVAAYNSLPSVERLFQAHGKDIAAVIVEPVAANMGVVPPEPGFLPGLRQITRAHGSLLIFDEVITGFRLGLGGAQARYGVRPDLTCLGKIIGGGLPVGAYGGRRDLMEQMAPTGPVYQAGTLSGNPLAMAAGIATLRALQQQKVYDRLESLGARLENALRHAAQKSEVPAQVNRVGSLLTLFFTSDRVIDYDSARKADTRRFAAYFHAMLDAGVYLPCSQFEALFLSLAHTEEEVANTGKKAEQVLAGLVRTA
jgi:glutamate-1-semialdehyde 2,1-aminomutase